MFWEEKQTESDGILMTSSLRSRLYLLGFIVVLFLGFPRSAVFCQTITASQMPSSFAGGGGTGTTGYPYAVYAVIQGFTACANSQAYVKFYSGSLGNEYMWSATNVWSNTTTYSSSNQPVVSIDASGNWSGWIYVKHYDALTSPYKLRAAKVGATSTNVTSGNINFMALNMTLGTGTGGWIVRASSPAVNKGILAYSGTTLVGSYRTEDNGITEGYSYSSGGYKIAVPVGTIDSLVTYNDDGSRDQLFIGPWSIIAGQETDASTGAGHLGIGSASVVPSFIAGGVSQPISIHVLTQSPYTLTNAEVVIPSTWTWSQSTTDIVLAGGGSPVASVSGDTIYVSGMTLAVGDSLQIQVNNMTPADTTLYFTFPILTGTSPDSIYAFGAPPEALVHGTPLAIADVKPNDANGVPLMLNQFVTIHGIVTVANEFGSPSYVQDNTAGIAVYGTTFSSSVSDGDELILTGLVSSFYGLTELGSTSSPPIIVQTVSHGNTVVPLVVTCAQVTNDGAGGVEQYEGSLVRLNAVTVTSLTGTPISTWAVSGSGTNYRLTDASDTLEIRVDNNVNFAGLPAPSGPFDVIGIVGQYVSASPYIGGYQFQPRSSADILASGPIFATVPVESNITSSSMTISWSTVNNGTTRLKYGTSTAYELGVLSPDNSLSTSHAIGLTSLTAATVYHVQAFSVGSASDTSFAGDLVVSTSSPSRTTGQMNVYFNFNIDTSVSFGEKALGNQNLIALILARINNARYSIDAALYSLSGTSQGNVVANALIAARNRGVRVRVICEHDNISYSGFQLLISGGVPLIDDTFDPVDAGAGLMHNKFFVFDAVGGAPDSVWVWGGSWNPTVEGTTQDHQNSIEIQDVALANAYTMEFNQMWGSSTATPNSTYSRFGSRKADITPHNFVINGIPVSSYFSPSDQTTAHIRTTLGKAQHSIASSILTFTRQDIADTIIARKNAGSKARVVMDNNTDTGNQYAFLLANGVDVHLKGFSVGLLHHKYAVVDADQVAGTQYTVTGSHNWSTAAETVNDENTLIVQSKRIANLYLQEFSARYLEAGGTDSIKVSTSALFSCNKSAINFGSVSVGGSKQDSFFVTNSGNIALTISSDTSTNPRFTVVPGSASVAPSGSQKFVVTFSPIATGAQAGSIVIAHNAPGTPDTVSVQGAGSGAPAFFKTAATINFDTVVTGTAKPDSFKVVNTGNALLKVSSVLSSNPLFTVAPDSAAIMPSDTQTFVVTFSPVLPGTQLGKFYITHNASGSPDSVSVQGVGKFPLTIAETVSMLKDWNMVSIPVVVGNGSRAVVFPHSSSQAFAYQGKYVSLDSLMCGIGYWMKFPSAETDTVSGMPLSTDSLTISARWNMIGSIAAPVAVSSIIQAPRTTSSLNTLDTAGHIRSPTRSSPAGHTGSRRIRRERSSSHPPRRRPKSGLNRCPPG